MVVKRFAGNIIGRTMPKEEEEVELVVQCDKDDQDSTNSAALTAQSDAEERSAAKATSEMFFWFGTLTVVSTILTVTNKYLMKQYPFPNMILLLQSAMSALLLCGASLFRMTDIKPISLGQISIFLVSSLFKVAQGFSDAVAERQRTDGNGQRHDRADLDVLVGRRFRLRCG